MNRRWSIGLAWLVCVGCGGQPVAKTVDGPPPLPIHAKGAATDRVNGSADSWHGVLVVEDAPRTLPRLETLASSIPRLSPFVSFSKDHFAAELVDGDLAPFVDLAQPIRIGYMSASQGAQRFAISTAWRSGAERAPAFQKIFSLTPRHNNKASYTVVAPRDELAQTTFPACGLFAQAGATSRLACTATLELLDRSGDDLVNAPLDGDAGLVLHLRRPLLDAWRQQVAQPEESGADGDPKGSKAFQVALQGHADRWMNSLQSVSLSFSLDQQRVTLAANLEVAPSDDLLSYALTGPAASPHGGLPPGRGGLIGVSSGGVEGARLKELVKPLWQALTMDVSNDTQADRAFMALAQQQLFVGGAWALRYGMDVTAAEAALADDAQDLMARRLALQGWLLISAPEPTERWVAALRRWVELEHEPATPAPAAPASAAAAGGGGQAGQTAPTASRPPPKPPQLLQSTSDKPLSKELQADGVAVHFVTVGEPNPKYELPEGKSPALPHTTHLLVGGNSDHVVFSISEHEDKAIEKLREALSMPATTRGRAPAWSAAIVTVAGMALFNLDDNDAIEQAAARDRLEWVRTLGAAATAPIEVALSRKPRGHGRTLLTLRAETSLDVVSALLK